MSTDIELRKQPTAIAAMPSAGTMRLVEWAQEAVAAQQLAVALCSTPFAGQFRGDPDAGAAAILRGHEMGLTPVTSLAAFDLIQGQPAPKAITLRALVQSHGHDLEIIESNAQHAVARYRRSNRGDWLTCEFTIEQARAMKLLGKDNWQKQPVTMLEARVTSKAARLVASDVILGIGYSSEELRDQDSSSSAPVPQANGGGLRTALASNEPAAAQPEQADDYDRLGSATRAQVTKIQTMYGAVGITERADKLDYATSVIDRQIGSANDLSFKEAHAVIDALTDLEAANTDTGEISDSEPVGQDGDGT
ncbi:MAG: hypothetical protein ACR2JO_07930 [Mycobacteriales bacterium]